MSGIEWTKLPRHGSPDFEREWRRYCAHIGDNPDALRLNRGQLDDGWWWITELRRIGYMVRVPGGDLPDAEAQALAVPTLCAALRAVLADLESA